MAETLGSIIVSATIQERTWRTEIETALETAPADYSIKVHREIVVIDSNGNVAEIIRNKQRATDFAVQLTGAEKTSVENYSPTRTYTATDAEGIAAGVTPTIISVHETIIAAQKAAEAV